MAILELYWDDLYQNKGGPGYETSQSLLAVPSWFNDQCTSYHLQHGYSAVFYQNANYDTPMFWVGKDILGLGTLPMKSQDGKTYTSPQPEDNEAMPWGWNDALTSIKLFDPSGIQIGAGYNAWNDPVHLPVWKGYPKSKTNSPKPKNNGKKARTSKAKSPIKSK